MATKLDTRPDSDQDSKIQRHYDDEFNRLSNPEHMSRSVDEPRYSKNLEEAERNTGANARRPRRPTTSTDELGSKEANPSNAWKNLTRRPDVASPSSRQKMMRFIKNPKKGGATGVLIALVVGGAFSIGTLLTPATLLFHLKESLLNKFNDQLTSMELRTNRILVRQLNNNVTAGACKPIKFRCRYQTMSERQVKRLEKKTGGKIKVVGDKTITGRIRPTHLEVETRSGIVKVNAGDLLKTSATNVEVNDLLKQGYNPKYAVFADKTMKKFAARVGLSKGENIKPGDKASMQEDARKASTEEGAFESKTGITCEGEGEKKKCYGKDGKEMSPEEVKKAEADFKKGSDIMEKELKAREDLKNVHKNVAKQSFKGAIASVALGLGAADTACSGYLLIRVVGFAAKYLGSLQLLREFFAVMNAVDQTIAGNGIAEVMTFFGNKMMAADADGRTATDSEGLRYAYHGDLDMPNDFSKDATVTAGSGEIGMSDDQVEATNQKDTALRYVNGQFVRENIMTDLVSIIDTVASATGGNADSVCGFIKSGWGQATLVLVGIFGAIVGIFSGGTSIGAGAAAQIAVSISIGIAVALLTPKLFDLVKGTVVTGLEEGPAFGSMLTSGAGAYNASASLSRGLGITTPQTATAYHQASDTIQQQYIAMENLHRSPFDTSSKYTALGSILFAMTPYVTKMNTPIRSLSSLFSLVASTPVSFIKPVQAASSDEFTQCQDSDYKAMGLAADKFCNLRGGEGATALSLDPDEVAAEMVSLGQVDEVTGEAVPDSDYAKYLELCVNRVDPIGAYSEETLSKYGADAAMGKDCVVGDDSSASASSYLSLEPTTSALSSASKYAKYRVYTIDKGISESLEGGYAEFDGAGSDDSTNDTQVDGSIAELAQIVLDSSTMKIADFSENPASDTADRSLASLQLQDMAAGKKPNTSTRCGYPNKTADPDINLMKFLADVAQNGPPTTINTLFGQCHSPASNHPRGKAVDFGCPADTAALDKIGTKYGVSHNDENCTPSGNNHWHYSVGGH